MTRVAVLGAKGRMGSESVRAINAADGLEVVAEIDLGDSLDQVTAAGAEVALDFTQPHVALDNVLWCIEHGVDVVVGTSGFDDERIAAVRSALGDSPASGVLVVPNFSIGAILMMRFAATAAPFFESVEVIEMHHPDKVDAPSGTAVRTAELIAASRREAGSPGLPDATTTDPDGARGAKIDGIPVHSVRARGFVASQQVLMGGAGEEFTIRHDSHDRTSFMPGVVAAVRGAGSRPGLTVGLDDVLGL
ncbi:4-hydroxy-tetrahydrodipicolinate reductase [Aeromicrobium sp. SMF47]|uniref:4-hydroxy-tetrahydrodipicolinate reductase n=1 Tax=Aeromicrobium yanjiei TaxID=2662028 RepID=A0A5Q2MN88_9ACTN|nr:4-hydroxy-tetrahydrodipicolinate reductase [Aeromicrobium yanjiei]MRJ76953.1 4-hydroxy-tetrahydrodipicolinate reductase [Aeromicrobium yanjiei]QGG41925.1 4-hydroxy-tetrahydrodipicolinate reductase [Aeromicrobium yanjiei]